MVSCQVSDCLYNSLLSSDVGRTFTVIRKIFAPVRSDGLGGCVLAYATTLAFRFDAYVEVTHCRITPQDTIPTGVPLPAFLRKSIFEQAVELADTEEQSMREQFEHFARVLEIKVSQVPGEREPSAVWREEPGKMSDVIKRRGRLADLIVVTKPDRDRNLGANSLQSALFHTGRPVLMCPQKSKRPDSLGDNVAIAWNGSVESSRSVGMTVDIVERAESVTILTAGREAPDGARAEDLQEYYALRSIQSTIDRFQPKGKIGDALLRRCDEIGADLMIMGAYSDSHEREAIFGGNSQVIVDNAEIPVVMVH